MAKIAIIGSGVVGKATGKGLIKKGHDVVFYDINPLIIEQLATEGFNACSIERCSKDREVFMLSISTPTKNECIDLSFLESAAASLSRVIKQRDDYSVVVVRSTVPPGTIEEVVVPIIQRFSGKKVGKDFGVCMNPEYLREATAEADFENPRLITLGVLDHKTQGVMEEIYDPFKVPIFVVSIREAEFQKYVHNLLNAVKISFFNEMREISKLAGISPDKIFEITIESAEASWNPKYGTKNLGPFGGSCLPKDTQAFLSWTKQKFGKKMNLLNSVIKLNKALFDRNSNS